MGRLTLQCHPVTPDRWDDLVALFGQRGACGGCWCMWWRLPAKQFEAGKGPANKRALRRIVARGEPPGLLAYRGEEPVGWCALAPREDYPRLDRSRVLKRIDDRPVWSVGCLFVRRDCRGQGVSVQLLRAAADYVRSRGGRIVEGYPVEPRAGKMPAAFVWTGLASGFRSAGFTEVARRSDTRPIMRRRLRPGRAARTP